MIHLFLLQNLQGVSRFSKWFQHPDGDNETEDVHKVESDIHRLTAFRPDDMTNAMTFSLGKKGFPCKLLYRRYAGLVFSLVVDMEDNDLALLESIHLFVEILDQYFKSVCELDIVFNFAKMLIIVDEFYLAGEMQETNKEIILQRVRSFEAMD